MKYQVSLDLPEQPENAELEVLGFGLFMNGHSRTLELTDEQVDMFEASHGFTLTDAPEDEEVAPEEVPEEEPAPEAPAEPEVAPEEEPAEEGGET